MTIKNTSCTVAFQHDGLYCVRTVHDAPCALAQGDNTVCHQEFTSLQVFVLSVRLRQRPQLDKQPAEKS